MTAYEQYLEGLRLRHFSPREIAYLGASHAENGLNSQPPRDLWANIVHVAWVADLAREAGNTRIKVLSGFRNEAYNRAVGGAVRSQHRLNRALDLQPLDKSPDHLAGILRAFRHAGVFKGGIGVYSSFVHVDTRGENVQWEG